MSLNRRSIRKPRRPTAQPNSCLHLAAANAQPLDIPQSGRQCAQSLRCRRTCAADIIHRQFDKPGQYLTWMVGHLACHVLERDLFAQIVGLTRNAATQFTSNEDSQLRPAIRPEVLTQANTQHGRQVLVRVTPPKDASVSVTHPPAVTSGGVMRAHPTCECYA